MKLTIVFLALVIIGLVQSQSSPPPSERQHGLKDYVYQDDFHFAWNVSSTVVSGRNYKAYSIFLTSQKWLSSKDFVEGGNGYIWQHWLQVCVPDSILPDSNLAFMYIDGGGNPLNFNNPPSSLFEPVAILCTGTNTIGAHLQQIPNEPIRFATDPNYSRSEDAMIAYTWSHFINDTFEYDWLARMPMTKASIKAMDAIQQFVATLDGVPPVTRFVVGGASKRGWTTWMVGAMEDPRVVGIIPIVAPIANLIPQINEMWQSYGNWSFALQDYTNMNLMGWLNLPRFQELLSYIDPLYYPEAMAKIPKYEIGALGDEFFMPDAVKYFWDDLPGQKYLRMVPNAEHSMVGHVYDVLSGAEQFYMLIYYNQTNLMPDYTWEISEDGTTITVTTQQTANLTAAKVYTSQNNSARDWRLITCTDGISCINLALWAPHNLEPVSPGVYTYTLEMPPEGYYSAFIIELEYEFYPLRDRVPMKITSNVSIIPTTLPYAPCPQDVCYCGYDCATSYYGNLPQ